MNEFQQEYIEEAKQLLKDLEHALLQLEKHPGDSEHINTVYRLLHTLKGSAGMFGYTDVERLAHELEYLFSDIREGIRQQDDFILDFSLNAVDVFTDLINGADVSKLVDKIILDMGHLKEEKSASSGTEVSSQKKDKRGFAVILTPEKNIFKRGLNFSAILQELQELGVSQLIIHNEGIPFEKQIAAREITSWLEVLFVTDAGPDEIRDVLMFLKPSEFEIFEITDGEVFTAQGYKKYIELSGTALSDRLDFAADHLPHLFSQDNNINEEPVPSFADIPQEAKEEPSDEDPVLDKNIRKSGRSSHVSVSTGKLDQLINVVSELVIFRSEISHLMGDQKNAEITEALEKLERLTLRLRDSAFSIRLVPLNILNVKLQRLIRNVSRELGKEIEFITEGLDTELDRSMINALEAPLMHIIRNAIDHGIESPDERKRRNKPGKGLLKFYSYNSGDHVFIQIQDDGNGIDFDKIRDKGMKLGLLNEKQHYSEKELVAVMMSPGFSTSDQVTTVSGRGVGLDVVKRDVAAMRGDIDITTEKGLGSIFTLRLPLTLTILDTLVVGVSDNKYLIPINEIEYCFKQDHAQLFRKKARQINHEGQLMPFVSLREFFGMTEFPKDETVIIINKNDTRMAVVVDSILGKLQTVYKPLNELLHPADCFSGASILGDGSMALILNALKLKN